MKKLTNTLRLFQLLKGTKFIKVDDEEKQQLVVLAQRGNLTCIGLPSGKLDYVEGNIQVVKVK